MSYPGLFIALEGVDGSGKSTQAQLMANWLAGNQSCNVVLTREPGGTDLGANLRQLIQHGEDMDPRTEALLYAADRAHHVNTLVLPALQRGDIVVTDRYFDSSVAYQSAGRQLPADQIEQISLWATAGLLPDITILIDIDPEIARTRQVGEPDRIEKAGIEFQQRVRAGYLSRVQDDPVRWLVVSGVGTPDEVFAAAIGALEPRLDQWRNRPTEENQ